MAEQLSSSSSSSLWSPPVHRGLTELDRSLFAREVPVLAARVPAPGTGAFRKQFNKDACLQKPRLQTILNDPSSADHRLVLLRSSERGELPPALLEHLSRNGGDVVTHTVKLSYDYWSADDILQAILPEEVLDNTPTAFTLTGHIAHLNLRDEYLPYRHLIGQVILDKNRHIRTVVNKLETIDNKYRNFRMEVLAGDEDFDVTLSEGSATFKFDFSKVYWNSRLQGEHARLVQSFDPADVVVDAFAGVGPFAIPAAKKGCAVVASDLNPDSASALEVNARLNRVQDTMRLSNDDARELIHRAPLDVFTKPFEGYAPPISSTKRAQLIRRGARDQLPQPGPPRWLIDHFVMNLPATAIELLDAYRGCYRPLLDIEGGLEAVEAKGSFPLVHCYCFTKDVESPEQDILQRASSFLGYELSSQDEGYNLHFVRDVAPKKGMYCLQFRLPREVVFAT